MTATSERRHARLLTAGYRIAAFALVLAAACVGAVDRNVTTPTGVIGPTGGGGGSSGGGGDTFAGLYRLQTVNDSAVPDTLAKDSVSGTGTKGDTTRVFIATIDSSRFSLNSDSSVEQFDYLTIRDARTASDSSFNRTISFGDTTAGTYSVSGSTVTVTIIDTVGGTHTVVTPYAATGSTLTGTVAFEIFNTDGFVAAAGSAVYQYQFTGPPLVRVVRPSAPGMRSNPMVEAAPLRGAAAPRAGVRMWRPSVLAAARQASSTGRARIRP